jgi:Ca-activated chloride channel family protein
MRRLLVCLSILLAASGALAAAEFEVAIVKPEPGAPAFGLIEVEAVVYPTDTELDRVEVYLDGLRVGFIERPPWRVLLDVGQENVAHELEVVAIDAAGNSASNQLRTASVVSDLVIDVDLQQLYVTVERDGARVLDLQESDFRVVDASVGQEMVTFERGDVPFTAAVLVDSSLSMKGGRLPTALEAAKAFIGDMKELDEAKLILFSDQVQVETPFTNSATILALSLGNVSAGGGTALNDAVYLAQKRLQTRHGRKVIILLSDGIDVESVLSMEQVQRLSRSLQAALYWIRLPRPGENDSSRRFSAWRDDRAHARELQLLRETVIETGGRIITIDSIDDVHDAFQALLTELREQYVIGYYPSITRGTGSWHEVEVQVGGENLDVRTRRGYLEN